MTRLEKINHLIATMYGGKQAAFAAAIGKSPAQVNQWKSGYREVGPGTCRHIEQTLNLPMGWMDSEDDLPALRLRSGPVECFVELGEVLHAADAITRAQISPLMQALLETPENAQDLGNRLQITLEGAGLKPPYAPGKAITSSSDSGAVKAGAHADGDDLDRTLERLSAFIQSAPAHSAPMVCARLEKLIQNPLDWKATADAIRPLLQYAPQPLD